MAVSSLQDWRGLAVGRLLVMRDVTAQKLAQAQLLEQQTALATLKEREQVARELHDQLSQELALINVQAQLVRLAGGWTGRASPGTVNGTLDPNDAYNFMLLAGDGSSANGADTFSIRIW